MRLWQAVLTLFDERCEKLTVDHPDAKMEMDLVQTYIVQIGQLVQNSPKVNGNGAKHKQPVDRAEPDRWTFCKFLDGQVLFHMYTAAYAETEGQSSTEQEGVRTGRCFTSRTKQMPKERR